MLQVEVKHALLQLVRQERVMRSKVEGTYVYMSADSGVRRRQRLLRSACGERLEIGSSLEIAVVADELKAGIILFFSLLDEKQRRLYAGMEAARLGHGGDRKIAALLGLDPHTVSKGRRELFSGSVERDRVRRAGGGVKRVEKNARGNRRDSLPARARCELAWALADLAVAGVLGEGVAERSVALAETRSTKLAPQGADLVLRACRSGSAGDIGAARVRDVPAATAFFRAADPRQLDEGECWDTAGRADAGVLTVVLRPAILLSWWQLVFQLLWEKQRFGRGGCCALGGRDGCGSHDQTHDRKY